MSEKSLDILSILLGSKVKEILSISNDAQRYLWEQVLSACLYSRGLFIDDFDESKESPDDFLNRMYFVQCLLKHRTQDDEVAIELLDKLDEGISSSDIIAVLSSIHQGGLIVQSMEGLNVAFPRTWPRHPYSYGQMYQALVNPIELFQSLLSIELNKEVIANFLATDFFQREIPRSRELQLSSPRDNRTLEDLYSEHERFMKTKKDALVQYIYDKILTHFEAKCEKLEVISRDIPSKSSASLFDKHVKFKCRGGVANVEINESYLETMINLGQYDSFIDSVKISLKEEVTSDQHISTSKGAKKVVDSENTMKAISSWQKVNSMGIVKKLDQCPRIVACLLSFDLKWGLGMFSYKFNPYIFSHFGRGSPKKRGEAVYIISSVFRLFLLYKYDPKIGVPDEVTGEYCHHSDFRTFTKGDLDPRMVQPIEIMSDWSRSDDKRTIELFKKIPKDLIEKASKCIDEQIKGSSNNGKASFPLNTKIPMPLWVKV